MNRYDAHIRKDWREGGLTDVLVTRTRDDGMTDIGVFLVDVWCLGVKDACLVSDASPSELEEILSRHLPVAEGERIHPACARKLIEGAIAYAAQFGFAPHRDYRKARRVLSGIDATVCPEEFVFGCEGRPRYMRGAGDSDERVTRVCAMLEAHCGPGGFDFVDSWADEAQDAMNVRESLMELLAAQPPSVPGFHELSGLMTGMQVCPTVVLPGELLKVLRESGMDLENKDDAEAFLDLLLNHYWNDLADLVLETIAPDAPESINPIDIWEEDWPQDDGIGFVASMVAWARGFERATRLWPEAWGDALKRADLAPHWEVVNWWARFEDPDCRDKIVGLSETARPRTLPGSVRAITRALRTRTPPG